MNQIGQAALGYHHDMGSDLYTARDFLELHERLEEDIKVLKLDWDAVQCACIVNSITQC